ncbi:MAG: FecR family protein [candidate division WOR-3 bacterium]
MLFFIFGTILNFYTNDVVIKRGDTIITPSFGMEMKDIDTIIVRDSSKAEVLYSDSSLLYIDENSKIVLEGKERRSVFISFGRIWAKVKKLLKGESFEVKNPLSISGVVGTEFEVSYINDEVEVKVVEGKIKTMEIQTGKEVILEKERLAKIRRNLEIEVREFKLREMKRWYEWKEEQLDFLLRKIEETLDKGREKEATRLMIQGYTLAKRLALTEKYERVIKRLREKHREYKKKRERILNELNKIDEFYNVFAKSFNEKYPLFLELSGRVERLRMEIVRLRSYRGKEEYFLIKERLNTDKEVKEVDILIKDIEPEKMSKESKKLKESYKFLKELKEEFVEDPELSYKVEMCYGRIKDLIERLLPIEEQLTRDIRTFEKIKVEFSKRSREFKR